ncbi:27281_t:CDS:1, partial [Racocetra persica]
QAEDERTTSIYCEIKVKEYPIKKKIKKFGKLLKNSKSEGSNSNDKGETEKEYEEKQLINQAYLYQEIFNDCLPKYYLENQTINEEKDKSFNIDKITDEQKYLLKNLLEKYKNIFV